MKNASKSGVIYTKLIACHSCMVPAEPCEFLVSTYKLIFFIGPPKVQNSYYIYAYIYNLTIRYNLKFEMEQDALFSSCGDYSLSTYN
jgi:hypothetical protein